MKSRGASPEPSSQRPGMAWVVVPLAALVTSAVLGLALFGGDPGPGPRPLTGGPLVEHAVESDLPRAEPIRAAPGTGPIAPAAALVPTPEAPAPVPETLSSASRLVPIEVYTASWCTACATAERWMDDNDIAYSEIDVDHSPGARDQLVALNPRRTLPTFDIAGEVLVGFDPGRLGAAIEGAARRRVR